jgi:phenylpyruvate tautomerase PptA (4-oxalocrotonate tautomerase family)
MPLINVYTSANQLSDGQASALLKELSASLARQLHKPESYVLTCLVPRTHMTFAGQEGPSCYVEVKSIGGLTPQVTKALSRELCATLEKALKVPGERIYLVFGDIPAQLWGHDGDTFG